MAGIEYRNILAAYILEVPSSQWVENNRAKVIKYQTAKLLLTHQQWDHL